MNLLPFQKDGVDWLTRQFRGILADEMGLGKTVQILGLINRCPGIRRILVICPASLKLNWRREASIWCPNKFSTVVSGTARGPIRGELIIINFDILSARLGDLPDEFDLVVVDEAHYLKNPASKRSRAVFSRLIKANRMVYLTGTPIPNRPRELWPILYSLNPKEWGSQHDFERRYANGHYDCFGAWVADGASHLDELATRLSSCMLRRLKSEVLPDLPPKFRRTVELDAPHADPVSALGVDWRRHLLDAVGKYASPVDATTRREDGEAKADAAARYCGELLDCGLREVIVFYYHTSVGDRLQQKLEHYGCVRLGGETSMKNRDIAVQTFQAGAARVFLGQIQAAGVGITLTRAHHVVMTELPWVPGDALQAEDRAARIGQKQNVQIDYLVAADSIDSCIAPAIVWKMGTIERALGDVKSAPDAAAEIFSADS